MKIGYQIVGCKKNIYAHTTKLYAGKPLKYSINKYFEVLVLLPRDAASLNIPNNKPKVLDFQHLYQHKLVVMHQLILYQPANFLHREAGAKLVVG